MSVRRSNGQTLERGVELAIVGLAVIGLACASLQQKAIGRRFDAANRIVLDATSSSEAKEQALDDFGRVVADLGEQRIEALPPESRADAYIMRAYAEWRGKQLGAAKYSSRRAELDPELVAGSHADVMSQLLPGLIVSDREILRWIATGRSVNPSGYKAYENNFIDAIGRVEKAQARVSPNTPQDTRAFVPYAKWRIAADWARVRRSLVAKPNRGPRATGNETASMLRALGAENSDLTIKQVLGGLRQQIPAEGPLRALARAQKRAPRSRW